MLYMPGCCLSLTEDILIIVSSVSVAKENARYKSEFGALRALIVDDDEYVRDLLATLLKELGLNVVMAVTDGTEAVDYVGRHGDDIDVVFLDLVMKKLHGNVALPILKSKKPELKVIIVSAFFMNYNTHFLANLGANGFLEKPFTIKELESVIANVCVVGDSSG